MTQERENQEKRKSPRIDFHLQVEVKGKQKRQEIKNFGLYGVFMETDPSFKASRGDEISIIMQFPNEDEPLEVKGQVVHASEDGVGVVFPGISTEKAMVMEACFSIFKGTLPMPEK